MEEATGALAKKTRARHDERPRLSQAQLNAYRVRKAATVVARPAVEGEDGEEIDPSQYTQWGHIGQEYAIIRSDLARLLLITAGMLVIIIVLSFVL